MTLTVGDAFPTLTVQTCDALGAPEPLALGPWLAGRKVVVFGVPGAFTPTCSARHLPGFVAKAAALRAKGIAAIGCHSVNDAFVMGAWAESAGSDDITMIADGAARLTKALGLEVDLSDAGLGLRCKRYAAILEDGRVSYLGVEEGQDFGVSSAEAVLEAL